MVVLPQRGLMTMLSRATPARESKVGMRVTVTSAIKLCGGCSVTCPVSLISIGSSTLRTQMLSTRRSLTITPVPAVTVMFMRLVLIASRYPPASSCCRNCLNPSRVQSSRAASQLAAVLLKVNGQRPIDRVSGELNNVCWSQVRL
uniref:Uncharacterized protein n=1 Tax=Pseudomonas sp. PyR19 TaxID=69249 RepID=O31105_9PROT|nr:unknown protein [Pseudomonas sp. PyR19]